jgi:site-specific recombinase XerD
MKEIRIKPGIHEGKKIVILEFKYDKELIDLTKRIRYAGWSRTLNAWYLPHSPDIMDQLRMYFKGKAWLRYDKTPANKEFFANYGKSGNNSIKGRKPITLNAKISMELKKFEDWMRNKRYSESTITTYTQGLKVFFNFLDNKPPEEIENEDLERFNKEYIIARKYSVSFQSQVINGVKLFFCIRQKRKLALEFIERPKRPKLLPNVLSKEEVKQILNIHKNIKHRAMLSLIYACGLRRGELLNLKIQDVDSGRGLLIIRQAKGRKDRVTPLSKKLLELLREYYKYEKPKRFLFEGVGGEKYSAGSLQKVLKNALVKAKIRKPVTLHWLRHSYATHLLENGTDLRYIQELLGHNSSRTTEIYTHVTDYSIKKIKSPFDDL